MQSKEPKDQRHPTNPETSGMHRQTDIRFKSIRMRQIEETEGASSHRVSVLLLGREALQSIRIQNPRASSPGGDHWRCHAHSCVEPHTAS
jgi:hypothetical protein